MTISEQLKQSILDSELPVYQIAQEAGVDRTAIGRFLSEDEDTHRDIRLERTADKLAEYFGLCLAPCEKKKGRGAT